MTACDSLSPSLALCLLRRGGSAAALAPPALDTSSRSRLHPPSTRWPWGIWFGLAADERDVSICGTEQTHLSPPPFSQRLPRFPFLCVHFAFRRPSSSLLSLLIYCPYWLLFSFLLISFSALSPLFFLAHLPFTYLSRLPSFTLSSVPLSYLLPSPFRLLPPLPSTPLLSSSSSSFTAGYN